jgi:tRNA(Ile)-lysidine synthase
VALLLVHVDHRLDAGSGSRAQRARALATRLALPFELVELDVPRDRRRGESPEAAARRLRYAALGERLVALGASRLLTGHQRDDQIETILLQLLRGAPLERLAGMPRRRGAILRPLLDAPRTLLRDALFEQHIEAIDDPTNLDLWTPRNRVRHRLLPRLRTDDAGVDDALLALASRASALRNRLDSLLQTNYEKAFIEGKDRKNLGPTPARSGRELRQSLETDLKSASSEREMKDAIAGRQGEDPVIATSFLTALPEPLRLPALRWLLERHGTERLPSFPSMKAFLSLLSTKETGGKAKTGSSVALSLPGGRRLVARRGRLAWRERESRAATFSYTLAMPGEVELPELGLRLRIRRAPVESWMFRGDRWRVGFEADADRATVRSRRQGDRMRPLGAPGGRKLKAILIDRGIPAEARDRLPLLEIEGELAWVPGVALGERFALRGGDEGWLAELEALEPRELPVSSSERTRG